MKTRIQDQEAAILEVVKRITRQRYRLVVICGQISSKKSEVVQLAGQHLSGEYINLASDYLPKLIQDGSSPALGAYGPDDLIEFILSSSNKPDKKVILFDQIEPLLSTFGRQKAVLFFRMLSQVEPLVPVIIITYLSKQLDEARFPIERVLHI